MRTSRRSGPCFAHARDRALRHFFARARDRALGRCSIASSLVGAALLTACNLHNPGIAPDEAALSYPVALALSHEAEPRFLYVANSNFDLRYNAGSVHVYDLAKLDQMLAKYACRTIDKTVPPSDGGTVEFPDYTRFPSVDLDAGATIGDIDGGGPEIDAGEPSDGAVLSDATAPPALPMGLDAGSLVLPADDTATSLYSNVRGSLCDDRDDPAHAACCFYRRDDPSATDRGIDDIRASALRTDSFATGIAAVTRPDGSERLYVPISGRSRLVYLDVQDGVLSCGDQRSRCTRGPGLHSADDVPDDNFPGQPAALAVGTLSQLAPEGSLPSGDLSPDTPFVATAHTFVANSREQGGAGLFVEKTVPPATGSAPVLESVLRGLPGRPTSIVVDPSHRVLYLTSSLASFISRVGLRIDGSEHDPAQVDGEVGTRELLYETSRVYVTGLAQSSDLRDVALDPNDSSRLYALVRGSQESVVFLQLDPTAPAFTEARVTDVIRVGAGPSKLLQLSLGGRSFLLVSCYDARAIFVIDTDRRELVAVVRNLSGPYEMVFDASRKLLHVADFRVSVLRVVDLAGLVDRSEPPPRIVATLGLPRFEGGLE